MRTCQQGSEGTFLLEPFQGYMDVFRSKKAFIALYVVGMPFLYLDFQGPKMRYRRLKRLLFGHGS